MRDLNLMMAIVWLIFGCVLFTWDYLHPRPNNYLVLMAYLSLGMSAFRFLRWGWRVYSKRREMEQPQERTRRKEVVHPEFDVSSDADDGKGGREKET